ncbi:ABC transporter ATP-binding protein [Nocardioides terrisoli]|uniref:ABC transporter ATP-binding protein n=1 Tax=Nocardioides terrisoli TaxID=3388267 RepID=UPI00287B7F31|nr:ATP-binding cassette domain-containing protein [Nocardioides marmorisolisilvae]
MSGVILRTRNLGISFGAIRALDNISIDLKAGSTLGVVGANGSGKTTLLNLVTGIYIPTTGSVEFRGQDITRRPPHHRRRRGLARTFQHPQLIELLSIADNVAVGLSGRSAGMGLKPSVGLSVRDAVSLVGADEFSDLLPHETPFGMQKLVEVARALVAEPDVLLLDEPAAGLNAQERVNLADLLRRLRDRRPDIAILFIEHDLEFMRRVADEVIALESGSLIGAGGVEDVLSSAPVRRSLLGRVDEPGSTEA